MDFKGYTVKKHWENLEIQGLEIHLKEIQIFDIFSIGFLQKKKIVTPLLRKSIEKFQGG